MADMCNDVCTIAFSLGTGIESYGLEMIHSFLRTELNSNTAMIQNGELHNINTHASHMNKAKGGPQW